VSRRLIIEADGGFTTMHELGDAQPEGEQHFGRAIELADIALGLRQPAPKKSQPRRQR